MLRISTCYDSMIQSAYWAPFLILFKGTSYPKITKFIFTLPKNDIISGCRPICRQIFDNLWIFLNHAFYSYIPYFWFFEGNTPFLTKCQMAPLAAGENWFHTWAMATMQPNQKLPHVTLAWSILGRTWSPFKEVCLLWCCNI